MARFWAFVLFLAGLSALLWAHADDAGGTSCSAPVLSELTITFWQFAGLAVVFVLGAFLVGLGVANQKQKINLAGILALGLHVALVGALLVLASAAIYLSGPGFNLKTGFFVKSSDVHADIQTFIYGQTVNFSENRFQGTDKQELSGYIHFHDGNGHVIHLHASGVPLGYMFGSFGGILNSTCIQTSSGQPIFCSNSTDTLKFYVNGQSISDMGSYQFHDLDKLLISYGPMNQDVSTQISSVTNEACIASGKCPIPLGYPTEESCSS